MKVQYKDWSCQRFSNRVDVRFGVAGGRFPLCVLSLQAGADLSGFLLMFFLHNYITVFAAES